MAEPYAQNRKARHDYEILDRLEAGLVLLGHEVKSIQQGKINIAGAVIKFSGGRPILRGADIAPYQVKNMPVSYDPLRDRQLLLKQHEIKKLWQSAEEDKLTIVPLSVYNKNHLIKLELGIARPLKKGDKREALKAKSARREMRDRR
ncbi:MAG: SsrA-binding protein [Candidatus Harrisonbacteria bacterium CG10_big_fil_rev_8_21_14_0_10_49_15]|uniref:SsrA-binding protein n=1 Tax=Candidatus Harrisonbacteria bacterium CG10_big_fil_rev_8_21_14_0_10_49_15 TaxID=1974587 RepID=A0A2H0UNT0_9BACT|nr:MAG: SsrA-binding protein [Candidatus Harrisonbacteria bacterium CG10_big_fil_rev_8_21_14_0_10_49_15]